MDINIKYSKSLKSLYLNKKKYIGFTLLELVVVISLISILAVLSIPKWTASAIGLDYEARRLLNDIRYVQALSITSGQRYRWVKLSSNSYNITNQTGTAITLPSGGTTLTFSNSVTFGTLTNLPNNLIAFDTEGAPYTTSTIPGTALAAVATIPLTLGGNTRNVNIADQTGYGSLS